MSRYLASQDDHGCFVLDTANMQECFKTRCNTPAFAECQADKLNQLYAGWTAATARFKLAI